MTTAPRNDNRETTSVETQKSGLLLAEGTLLGVALIWGINIPVIKSGIERLDWFALNALRLLISAAGLGLIGWIERRRGVVPSSGLKWKPILIYAFLITVLYQLFFLAGVSRTASGTTSLILSTIPMWTALLARIFLGEQLRPAAWGGLLTAFTGTLIVSLDGGALRTANGTIIGNLSILAAAVSWAAGTVYSRPLMNSISPIQLAAWSTVLAMPLHLAIAVPGLLRNQQALLQPVVWGVILYSGLFSTGLALPMWNFGVRRAGAAQAAVFQNLVPVIAIAAAWLLRREPVTAAQVIGGTLIITGILTMRLAR